jgi:hypothetical protein
LSYDGSSSRITMKLPEQHVSRKVEEGENSIVPPLERQTVLASILVNEGSLGCSIYDYDPLNTDRQSKNCTDAALLFRLKQKALEECKDRAQAYADCCSGRVFSAVWSCREEFKDLNICLSQQ